MALSENFCTACGNSEKTPEIVRTSDDCQLDSDFIHTWIFFRKFQDNLKAKKICVYLRSSNKNPNFHHKGHEVHKVGLKSIDKIQCFNLVPFVYLVVRDFC